MHNLRKIMEHNENNAKTKVFSEREAWHRKSPQVRDCFYGFISIYVCGIVPVYV